MIYYWQAEILATVPNHVSLNDHALRHIFLRDPNVLYAQAIAKFLYFRDIEIENPIIATQENSSFIHIHPGINRFFGASLRQTQQWIHATILTNSRQPIPVNGIKWIKCIDKIKAKDLKKHASMFNQPGMSDNILLSHWIQTTKNARLEFSYNNKQGIYNPNGDWIIKESVEENLGIWNAVLGIFEQIDNYSL